MKNKVFALVALLMVASLLLAACGGGSAGNGNTDGGSSTGGSTADLGTEENPIVWALVPSGDVETVVAGAEGITAALEEKTGLVIDVVVTTDYSAAIEAMCNGEAQLGALNTFGYILASERGCADVALVSIRFGANYYTGQVITQAGSDITSYEDLVGKTFCRPDPISSSGWIAPYISMSAAGLDPENDLAEVVDADGHSNVVRAVYNGDCDAGATFVDARSGVEEELPDVMDATTVIAESDPIPNDNVSFATGVPADMREAIVNALVEMASTEDGLAILNNVYSWDGLEPVDDSFYDGFRQVLEAGGVDVSQFIGG